MLRTMARIDDAFQRKNESLKISKTAALWLQYMELNYILCRHITAKRTGNLDLYLQAVSKMLPSMAAAGHNNYIKSLHVYLQ